MTRSPPSGSPWKLHVLGGLCLRFLLKFQKALFRFCLRFLFGFSSCLFKLQTSTSNLSAAVERRQCIHAAAYQEEEGYLSFCNTSCHYASNGHHFCHKRWGIRSLLQLCGTCGIDTGSNGEVDRCSLPLSVVVLQSAATPASVAQLPLSPVSLPLQPAISPPAALSRPALARSVRFTGAVPFITHNFVSRPPAALCGASDNKLKRTAGAHNSETPNPGPDAGTTTPAKNRQGCERLKQKCSQKRRRRNHLFLQCLPL